MDELLIISGSMGSGKTTVLFEASDILASRDVAHAAIDLDALGVAYFESGVKNDEVTYRNLRSPGGGKKKERNFCFLLRSQDWVRQRRRTIHRRCASQA